jgi:hypothetical protein
VQGEFAKKDFFFFLPPSGLIARATTILLLLVLFGLYLVLICLCFVKMDHFFSQLSLSDKGKPKSNASDEENRAPIELLSTVCCITMSYRILHR